MFTGGEYNPDMDLAEGDTVVVYRRVDSEGNQTGETLLGIFDVIFVRRTVVLSDQSTWYDPSRRFPYDQPARWKRMKPYGPDKDFGDQIRRATPEDMASWEHMKQEHK